MTATVITTGRLPKQLPVLHALDGEQYALISERESFGEPDGAPQNGLRRYLPVLTRRRARFL